MNNEKEVPSTYQEVHYTVLLKRKNMNRKAANHNKNFEDAHANGPFVRVSSHPEYLLS